MIDAMRNRKEKADIDKDIETSKREYTTARNVLSLLGCILAYVSISFVMSQQYYQLAFQKNTLDAAAHYETWEIHCQGRNRAVTMITLADNTRVNCTEAWYWWEVDIEVKSIQDCQSAVWVHFSPKYLEYSIVSLLALWCSVLFAYRVGPNAKYVKWQMNLVTKIQLAQTAQLHTATLSEQVNVNSIFEAEERRMLGVQRRLGQEFNQNLNIPD